MSANLNTIGELRALRVELGRYETTGREDRAEQVKREITGRLAAVEDAIAQFDQQAELKDATGDHADAAEARQRAKEMRAALADIETDVETAAESTPRERAVTRKK